MKTGALNCLKYLMFIFNLLFCVSGVAAISIGVWALVSETSFRNIVADDKLIFNGVYVIIFVGAALFVLGFLGCCSAIKENRCLLGTFFVLVLFIFLLEIIGIIMISVYNGGIPGDISKSIAEYDDGTKHGKLVKQGWDTMQITVGCCGFKSYTEWNSSEKWMKAHPKLLVPQSCCRRDALSLHGMVLNETLCESGDVKYLYTKGCEAELGGSTMVLAAIGLTIFLIQILAMIFSCCLFRGLESNGEYKRV